MNAPDDQRALLAGRGAPQPGTLLAGKYRIERIIGIGGMGVVLAAQHEELGERVAIKCLLSHLAHDSVFVARFQREARAAVKIRSEHIARVLDVSKTAEGVPFIVMEYLEGQDLGAVLQNTPRLPAPIAIGYVLQACEALAEAHALGIVHRDLKPENLFLTTRADGTEYVKVMDFGISKMAGASADNLSLTRTGSGVMGSPLYMAPEQMRSSKQADPRTDIWALGAILFEFIVGDPPFVAASIQEVVAMIVQDPTPSLVERAAEKGVDVAHGLALVIERALAKRADDRYPDVGELAAALAEFGDDAARASAVRIARVLERRSRADRTGSSPSFSMPMPSGLDESGPRRERVGTQSAATWTDIRTARTALSGRSRMLLLGVLGVFGVALVGTLVAVSLSPSPQPPSATLPATTPVHAVQPAPVVSAALVTTDTLPEMPLDALPDTSVDASAPAPAASAHGAKHPGARPDKAGKNTKVPPPVATPSTVPPVVPSAANPNSGRAKGRHD